MNSKQAVLVVGDIMLDERIEGEMTRISPEAPAPVVRVTNHTFSLGGAANVAANIAALGHQAYLLGSVGFDTHANTVRQLCSNNGIRVNLWQGSQETTVKTRITCGGQQVLRYDHESVIPGDSHDHLPYMVQAVETVMGPHSDVGLIVVADYAKGVINAALMQQLARRGVPVFVDGKPQNKSCYQYASLLKPNFKEALAMLSDAAAVHPVLATSDLVAKAGYIAEQLIAELRVAGVVITLGAAGAVYSGHGRGLLHSSLPPQACFDVTGAGDTFMAVLADSYLHGIVMDEAILRANVAAAKAVSRHGTSIVNRDELEDALMGVTGDEDKIMGMHRLQSFIMRKRRAGRRIVFTNGTFRFLHQGHIELLKFAKQQGDILVVGINSDLSLAALKPGKAFVPAKYRTQLLAQMPGVDAVLVFDATNVEDTVKQIKPDVLVKGAEYVTQKVPGADFVARHGGEVKFAPMVEGIHATDLET